MWLFVESVVIITQKQEIQIWCLDLGPDYNILDKINSKT